MAILRANGSFLKANGKILVRPENKIDPDIVILQDWVTQDVGLQPTDGIPASLSARFDPNGPLDVSGTGWEGTPYVRAQDLGFSNVRVPSSTYDTNFPLYAANQYRYEQGITPYGFYTQGVDFTIEAWCRLAELPTSFLDTLRYQPLIGLFNDQMGLSIGVDRERIVFFNHTGQMIGIYRADYLWHHYALVAHENIIRIYVDGVRLGTDYPITPSAMTFFIIAKRGNVRWAGSWIDMANYDYAQVCLTKRAKWLENFTPPTRPYCLGMEE